MCVHERSELQVIHGHDAGHPLTSASIRGVRNRSCICVAARCVNNARARSPGRSWARRVAVVVVVCATDRPDCFVAGAGYKYIRVYDINQVTHAASVQVPCALRVLCCVCCRDCERASVCRCIVTAVAAASCAMDRAGRASPVDAVLRGRVQLHQGGCRPGAVNQGDEHDVSNRGALQIWDLRRFQSPVDEITLDLGAVVTQVSR